MRKLFLLAMVSILIGTVSCTKSNSDSNEAKISQGLSTVSSKSSKEGITPMVGDDAKKYASIICYLPSDPCTIGTECSVPGSSCKSYACTLTTAGTITMK
jgi:hypothetical protein